MTTIYIAEFKFREHRIVSVEVLKETAKQYRVDRSTVKEIHKMLYVPRVLHKDLYNIFATQVDAERWCLSQLRVHIDGLEAQMATARSMIDRLETKLAEVQP